MRTLVAYGSPRLSGNTATLIHSLLDGLRSATSAEIAEFVLNDMTIKPCQGCNRCQATLEPACVHDDDMRKVYAEWLKADTIVLGVPIYWWHMNGLTKMFVDRWHALLEQGENSANFHDKNFVLAISFFHPQNGDPVIEMFRSIAEFGNMNFHVLRHHAKTGRAADDAELLRSARDLGVALSQSHS